MRPASASSRKRLRLVGVARGEARQDRRQRARAVAAALGDLDGRRDRFRQIGEQRRHFGAALEPVLGRELCAVAVGDELALGDAEQRIVRFVVLARGEERLVGGDERQAARISEIDQRGLAGAFRRHAVALQFDIEPVAEQALQRFAARLRERILPAAQWRYRAGPCGPPVSAIRPLVSSVKRRELEMRPFLHRGAEIGARDKPHQAAIALLRGGQQHDARPVLFERRIAALLVGEIDAERAADNRLNAIAGKLFGKFQRTEHVVGVGQSQRRLAVFLRKLSEPRNGHRAFEQRIGRMHVQMHKAGHGSRFGGHFSTHPVSNYRRELRGIFRSTGQTTQFCGAGPDARRIVPAMRSPSSSKPRSAPR